LIWFNITSLAVSNGASRAASSAVAVPHRLMCKSIDLI
jgi:hypothetical protein